MSLILNIETATPICSVSLGNDGELLGVRETTDGKSHASHITVLIEELLHSSDKSLKDLDAIAVSMGPGSYTGLRIGVSTAKGFCYSLDKPLIAIETLKSMANSVREEEGLLCPMLDARRMEVYTALYDSELKELEPTSAKIIDETSFSKELNEGSVLFFGDGAEKTKELLGAHSNAIFKDGFEISATSMVSLAEEKFRKEEFEDVAYFEPFYLKDFVAGAPKKSL